MEAARALIESAGWTQGPDEIYRLKGRRLAADIPVRDNRPLRVKFAELVALQARDCGFDLTARPLPFGDLVNMLWNYPHLVPGGRTPFDLYVAGWSVTTDPGDSLTIFDSREASSKALPDGGNFGGFADPEVDRLLRDAIASYGQADRARAYKLAQLRLADDLPYLFGYALIDHDAMTERLESTAGPLAFDSLFWAWQVETLVVRR